VLKGIDDSNAGKYRSVTVEIGVSEFKPTAPESVPSEMHQYWKVVGFCFIHRRKLWASGGYSRAIRCERTIRTRKNGHNREHRKEFFRKGHFTSFPSIKNSETATFEETPTRRSECEEKLRNPTHFRNYINGVLELRNESTTAVMRCRVFAANCSTRGNGFYRFLKTTLYSAHVTKKQVISDGK